MREIEKILESILSRDKHRYHIHKETVEFLVKEAYNLGIEDAAQIPLTTERILWDDPKEGEDAYMNISIVDKESILKLKL